MPCTKKKLSENHAIFAIEDAERARRKGKFWRKEKRKYFCDECKAWHLTKKDTQ